MACKPDFDLNAPYEDVTVVYGILSYQEPIQYVKIYKGFQSKGRVFLDALEKDSIYYYNTIDVVLQEYNKDTRTNRPDIPLHITCDFPRDSGIFYFEDERIIYYTEEPVSKDYTYKIVITNTNTNKISEGVTPIVGDFSIKPDQTQINMLRSNTTIKFFKAPNAVDYEFHVTLLYFEVNNKTQEVKTGKIVKNITSGIGESYLFNEEGEAMKTFTNTFYDDIAKILKPNSEVTRYLGTPKQLPDGLKCFEIEGWAAGESMVNYLLSNKPTSSFVQINTTYTNINVAEGEGLAYGFLSSKVKCPIRELSTNTDSETELVSGSKTRSLGFRPRTEYRP